MAYNKVNSKVCVAGVLDKYNIPQINWISRAPEWIDRALGLMSIYSKLEYAEPSDITVASYKAELPCDIRLLLAVEYKGARLHCISSPTNTLSATDLALQSHPTEFYELDNSGYIITSFEEGDIRVHHMTSPVVLDTDMNIWFPMIPNNPKVIDAIEQYLLMRILLKGYKITELSLKDNNEYTNPGIAWNIMKKKAENSEVIIDVNEREEISKTIRTFLYDNDVYYNRDFNNTQAH